MSEKVAICCSALLDSDAGCEILIVINHNSLAVLWGSTARLLHVLGLLSGKAKHPKSLLRVKHSNTSIVMCLTQKCSFVQLNYCKIEVLIL